jgi:hypothetical protein
VRQHPTKACIVIPQRTGEGRVGVLIRNTGGVSDSERVRSRRGSSIGAATRQPLNGSLSRRTRGPTQQVGASDYHKRGAGAQVVSRSGRERASVRGK